MLALPNFALLQFFSIRIYPLSLLYCAIMHICGSFDRHTVWNSAFMIKTPFKEGLEELNMRFLEAT